MEVVSVSPKMARKMRDEMLYKRQRTMDKNTVAQYVREIKNDEFLPMSPVVLGKFPDGQTVILDGNHRLEAVAQSKRNVNLVFITHSVIDDTAAGRIYAKLNGGKPRTMTDTLRAMDLRHNLPMAQAVISAVGTILDGFSASATERRAHTEKVDAALEYIDEAVIAEQIVAKAETPIKKIFRRTPVLAVMLETIRHQPDLAKDFWGKIASDDRLKRGSPEKTLLRELQTCVTAGQSAKTHQMKAVALAWNAAYRKDSLSSLHVGKMKNFYLSGTPWSRKQSGEL